MGKGQLRLPFIFMENVMPVLTSIQPDFMDQLLAHQLDIGGAPQVVEVQISTDQSKLWVNINGVCALRVSNVQTMMVAQQMGEPVNRKK